MNSGDHSTSYVPSQDIDFPSADGGLVLSRKKVNQVKLLITEGC
jgi:hypothetical protein